MIARNRLIRPIHGLLLAALCLLIFSAAPPAPVQAATPTIAIDNTVAEFSRGQFQRAALNNALRVNGSRPTDQVGAVQLGLRGTLARWTSNSAYNLPNALINHGVTAVGDRLYVIGGEKPLGLGSEMQDKVWSLQVDLNNGALLGDWQAEPPLNPVVPQTGVAAAAPISQAAVTSVFTPGVGGYIYVLGGRVSFNSLSSRAVRYAQVGADGRIVGQWQELAGAKIPPPDSTFLSFQPGVYAASALSLKIGGRTFVYLIGGLESYRSGSVVERVGEKRVLYAEVGAGGKLYKPGTSTEGWAETRSVPVTLSGADVGIWSATAVADFFPAALNGTGAYAIYLIGGQIRQTPVYSAVVYRAQVAGDGAVTWFNDAAPAVMPQPRYALGGVTFRGNIYVVGGVPGTSTMPDGMVLTSYVADDLTLPDVDDSSSGIQNFLENTGALSDYPRSGHGLVLVRPSPNSTKAFVYMIGGGGSKPDEKNGTDTVIYATLGESETRADGYAPDGWFYGEPTPLNFLQAEVREIRWSTIITGGLGLDIGIDYRTSQNDCTNPTWTPWESGQLDGDPTSPNRSTDGPNVVSISAPQTGSRCFQYRARLVRGADKNQTPLLLNVGIKLRIPGSPDLWQMDTQVDQRDPRGRLTGINVTITNQNLFSPPGTPITFGADIDGGGDFYVDLYIYGPSATKPPLPPAPTIPVPATPPPENRAYAIVPKASLGPNAIYAIRNWCVQSAATTCTPFDPLTFLQQQGPGWYTVFVVVDSTDCRDYERCVGVDESDGDELRGEQNNVKGFQFQVAPNSIVRTVNLPITSRP